MLALVLQSAALLLHHTLAPHHHSLVVAAPGGGAHPDPRDGAGHKAPAPCPVWAALQHINGSSAASPPLPLPIVIAAAVPATRALTPPETRRLLLPAQPRAPPLRA